MKQEKTYSHRERQSFVHVSLILIFGAAIAIYLFGCNTPRNGCKATRTMSGYGYIDIPEELEPMLKDSGEVSGLFATVKGDTLCLEFKAYKP